MATAPGAATAIGTQSAATTTVATPGTEVAWPSAGTGSSSGSGGASQGAHVGRVDLEPLLEAPARHADRRRDPVPVLARRGPGRPP